MCARCDETDDLLDFLDFLNLPMDADVQANRKGEGDPTDTELMAQVKAGNEVAFDKLVGRHQTGLLNFYYRLTWDRSTAEDLAQEVFIRLFTHSETYEPVAKFTTYLYRIARNCWIDHLRKTKQERKLKRLDAEDADGGALRDVLEARQSEGPSDGARKEEYSEAIVAAIDALPEDQKLVFVLSEVQGMKYSEVAETLGVPVGTVKSRMHHAVHRLRDRLQKLRRKPPEGESDT